MSQTVYCYNGNPHCDCVPAAPSWVNCDRQLINPFDAADLSGEKFVTVDFLFSVINACKILSHIIGFGKPRWKRSGILYIHLLAMEGPHGLLHCA